MKTRIETTKTCHDDNVVRESHSAEYQRSLLGFKWWAPIKSWYSWDGACFALLYTDIQDAKDTIDEFLLNRKKPQISQVKSFMEYP